MISEDDSMMKMWVWTANTLAADCCWFNMFVFISSISAVFRDLCLADWPLGLS